MSDELAIIGEMAARLFGELCTLPAIAAAEAGAWPDDMWQAIEQAGLPLALVSDEGGGVGLGWIGAMTLVGLAGEHALPLPFVETMAAAWLLDRAGVAMRDGPLTFAIADGDHVHRVPWGRNAGVVVVGERGGESKLALIERDEVEWALATNMAGEPRDNATLVIAEDRWIASPVSSAQAHQIGAALRTAQLAGAMRRAAALAVRYATERAQFGRTLSKFQAIQQSLAVLATQASVATAAADMAARALAAEAPVPAVAIAKARASEAAGVASAIAHQIHGAIGFTLEHELQLATRRLLSWRDEFGNETEHYGAFGAGIAAAGAERLWPIVTGD